MIIEVTIQGIAPYVMHRYNEMAAIKGASPDRPVHPGEKLGPREEAESFAYRLPSGELYIPGPAVYKAIIDAGRFHKHGRTKLTTNSTSLVPGALWMEEESSVAIPLLWDDKPIRTFEVDARRIVNPSTGGAHICHRPIIHKWQARFGLTADDAFFDEKFVRALVDTAGGRVGIGAMRPQKKGSFGRFVVKCWQVEVKPKAVAA